MSGALKTDLVFGCGKIPAKQVLCSRRSKVSASRPYAPDTREVCFQGPSRALWYFRLCPPRRVREQAESRNQFGAQSFGLCVGVSRVFALAGATVSYCCVAQNRQHGAAALSGLRCRCGRFRPEGKELWFTCTALPDGSGARNGRLRPARCERRAALHAPGRRGSGGCNGSRLPAGPDTSRHPQPWRSG